MNSPTSNASVSLFYSHRFLSIFLFFSIYFSIYFSFPISFNKPFNLIQLQMGLFSCCNTFISTFPENSFKISSWKWWIRVKNFYSRRSNENSKHTHTGLFSDFFECPFRYFWLPAWNVSRKWSFELIYSRPGNKLSHSR